MSIKLSSFHVHYITADLYSRQQEQLFRNTKEINNKYIYFFFFFASYIFVVSDNTISQTHNYRHCLMNTYLQLCMTAHPSDPGNATALKVAAKCIYRQHRTGNVAVCSEISYHT